MGDFENIAKQFVEFYYKTFDNNRSELGALYRDQSMLTFENSPHQGPGPIVEKLTSLPFARVEHAVSSVDAHPSTQDGNILVVVCGQLLVDEEKRPMSYTQTFHLVRDPTGNYFVFNDIFRLVYPGSN